MSENRNKKYMDNMAGIRYAGCAQRHKIVSMVARCLVHLSVARRPSSCSSSSQDKETSSDVKGKQAEAEVDSTGRVGRTDGKVESTVQSLAPLSKVQAKF